MFSCRHSLNGRERPPHIFRGWTSEHYTSSAQLYGEMYAEVIGDLISRPVLFPSVPTFWPTAGRTANQVSGWKMKRNTVFTLDKMVTN